MLAPLIHEKHLNTVQAINLKYLVQYLIVVEYYTLLYIQYNLKANFFSKVTENIRFDIII